MVALLGNRGWGEVGAEDAEERFKKLNLWTWGFAKERNPEKG
jgi:hypothetical protein